MAELTEQEIQEFKKVGLDNFPPTIEEVKNHKRFLYGDNELGMYIDEEFLAPISINEEDGTLEIWGDGFAIIDNTIDINDIL